MPAMPRLANRIAVVFGVLAMAAASAGVTAAVILWPQGVAQIAGDL